MTFEEKCREEWSQYATKLVIANPEMTFIKSQSISADWWISKLSLYRQELLEEIEGKIEKLNAEFPVRESDEFDEGRISMKREVKNIISEMKK